MLFICFMHLSFIMDFFMLEMFNSQTLHSFSTHSHLTEILAQHRRNLLNQKQSNRPSSAKRRTPTFQETSDMSLGDTIRPGQSGNKFMKQRGQQGKKESVPPLSMAGKGGRSSPGMPSLTSPKLSPKDSKSLTDALSGKRSPSPKYPNQQPMSQEDIIFGRKTPTNDPRYHSYHTFFSFWVYFCFKNNCTFSLFPDVKVQRITNHGSHLTFVKAPAQNNSTTERHPLDLVSIVLSTCIVW